MINQDGPDNFNLWEVPIAWLVSFVAAIPLLLFGLTAMAILGIETVIKKMRNK